MACIGTDSGLFGLQKGGQLMPGKHTFPSIAAFCALLAMRVNASASCATHDHPVCRAGKKGVSLQQAEWQELRRDGGGAVQAAVDALLPHSAAAGEQH